MLENRSDEFGISDQLDHERKQGYRSYSEGLCGGLSHLFFGPAAERPERRVDRERMAKSVCYACPLLDQCRETGRAGREHGIWGAETEVERAAAGFTPLSPSRRCVLAAAKAHYGKYTWAS